MRLQLQGELQKFKEKFPRTTKWIQYAPQDGHPPMPQWGNIYKMADQMVAFCKYGQWVFKQWFDMDVPKIYHGVDTDTFKPMGKPKGFEDKFVIGNLNRNQPRKQPVRSMMAFAKFAKDKSDVLLHMQMDWNDEFGWPIQYFGELYGIMNKMIQPARVGMPVSELVKIYNMWDLSLNTTGGDGFCIPVIESFACGVPTVGVPYTTFQELIIDGEPTPRGSLAKIKDMHWQKLDVAAVQRSLVDVDDLANVMNKYYYNKQLAIDHGKNGRIWVEQNCSLKNLQHQWKWLVDKVLSGEKCNEIELK
jgi:glycosyltransferase involved in cell wall biosynthesis